jgi:hypothetical protein
MKKAQVDNYLGFDLAEWTGLYAKQKTSLISLVFLQFTLQKSATTIATMPSRVAKRVPNIRDP